MKREDRLIREMATELYECLQKEGALGVPEPYDFVIRTLRKSIRKAYKAGQESVPVPEQPVASLATADPVREEFVQFLQNQNVLKQFLKNYKQWNKKPFNINYYLNNRGEEWAEGAIYAGFLWRDTPEGVDFWSDIARKWQSHLATYIFS